MLELLKTFTVEQILIYIVMQALAAKGVVDFFVWGKKLYQQKLTKDQKNLKKQELFRTYSKQYDEQFAQFMEKYNVLENKIDLLTTTVNSKIAQIDERLVQLTRSDMHDIKGWIVEKHHELTEQGWVDDFTMDTLEKRFADYVAEKGNSYVEKLMADIRSLPHNPPN